MSMAQFRIGHESTAGFFGNNPRFRYGPIGICVLGAREFGFWPSMSKGYMEYLFLTNLRNVEATHSTTNRKPITNLEFSKDGKILLSCELGMPAGFGVHDTVSRKKVYYKANAHGLHCHGARFVSDNEFVTFSEDFAVKLWDLRLVSAPVKIMHGHENCVTNVDLIPGRRQIVTSSVDRTIRYFNLFSDWEQVWAPDVLKYRDVTRCRISAEGNTMVLGSQEGIIKIGNLQTTRLQRDVQVFRDRYFREEDIQKDGHCMDVEEQKAHYNNCVPLTKSRNRMQLVHALAVPQLRRYGVDVELNFFVDCLDTLSSLEISGDGNACLAKHSFYTHSHNREKHWIAVYDLRDDERGCDDYSPIEFRIRREPRWLYKELSLIRGLQLHHLRGCDPVVHLIHSLLYNNWERNLILQTKLNTFLNSNHNTVNAQSYHLDYPEYMDSAYHMDDWEARIRSRQVCFTPSGRFILAPVIHGFRILGFDNKGSDFATAYDENKERNSYPTPTFTVVHSQKMTSQNDADVLVAKMHPALPLVVTGTHAGTLNWWETRF